MCQLRFEFSTWEEEGVEGRLVMLTFANKGAGRDNRKADPEAIDDTTEHSYDLVAEEGRKGNDDQDGDGY